LYLPKARLHTTTPTQNKMATYNLAQENNQQNERIITMLNGIFERQTSVANFQEEGMTRQRKKIVEWLCRCHDAESVKLDRMIALLEKIAGE
jgi:hypothetical protein